ncbi:MAG: hypothetical protein SGJ19_11455 [Planctomycetia bacterium]|nr:hypothetical protein [Planctomycetia bacterium]
MPTFRSLAGAGMFCLAFNLLTAPLYAQAPAPAALASPVDELDWLVGEWTAESDGTQVRSVCEWDAGRRFLIRHVYVERDGRTLHSVGQRFGYDAASKVVKVWSFDSDGSHAEGAITAADKNWVFNTTGVAKSGEQWKSKNTYSDITSQGFTLTSASSANGGAAKTSVLKFALQLAPATAAPFDEAAEVSSDPAKQKILSSKEWREVRRSLHEWLSVQKIYSPSEIASIKAQVDSKIANMTAADLQDFLDDMRDKVAILLSKEGEDARTWLAQYLAVRVVSKDQWDKMRPDVVHMTAQQLKEKLEQLNQQQAAATEQSKAAAQGRDLQAQAIRQEVQYQRQAHENSLNRTYYDNYGSYRW